MEVSIQAVSPESVLHLLKIGGLAVASQAGSGAAGAAAGAAAGVASAGGVAGCANDAFCVVMQIKSPSRTPKARAISPAREGFFNVMV